MRADKRSNDEMRPISFQADFQLHPIASVMASFGATRVLCAISISESVPRWRKEQQLPGGWLTAEYQMLPGATSPRGEREVSRGKISGRSAEIQRLIGRSLRAVLELSKLPEITIHVDCDVIDADGGTRCAAISGAGLALELACKRLQKQGVLSQWPLRQRVAAVSVGMLQDEAILDLCYEEDAAAAVDMNVVMCSSGRLVEVQASGEEASFSEEELAKMMGLAKKGLRQIFDASEELLAKGLL
ncbi:MAG: ribonuclease PH [Oligosphaeraceae bacterium]|nr:ribonuclease PH [Oligosphaeraceae bacterium]